MAVLGTAHPIEWTERMRGHLHRSGDPGEARAVTLTVLARYDDLAAASADPSTPAKLTGVLHLGERQLRADGEFRLFVDERSTTTMRYDLQLVDTDGAAYTFTGRKTVDRNAGTGAVRDFLGDTFRQHVSIHAADGHERWEGTLDLSVVDFARMVASFTDQRDTFALHGTLVMAKLLADRFFGDYVLQDGRPHARPPRVVPVVRRPVLTDAHVVTTRDGVPLRLTRFHGGPKGPVLLAPGLGVKAKSFASGYVDTNFVESLIDRDFDVWMFDYRASPEYDEEQQRPDAWHQYDIDDIASKDWPAAISYVREVSGVETVDVVAHCVGSLSFMMAITGGSVPAAHIRRAVCSALTLHVDTSSLNRLKSHLRIADLLVGAGVPVIDANPPPTFANLGANAAKLRRALAPAPPSPPAQSWPFRLRRALTRQSAVAMALSALPVPSGERCDQPQCRMIFGLFGPSYRHESLGTGHPHDQIPDMFGRVSVQAFRQLGRIVRRGSAVDAQGEHAYLPHVDRLAFPILFLTGEHNQEFLPSSTRRTLECLERTFGTGVHHRSVIPGYGHMDLFMGAHAARDVFPVIIEHLDTGP